MKDLVTYIAASLVDEPDKVFVEEVKTEHMSILQLRVAKGDIGKVIGKKGQTAGAIRTILQAGSSKMRKRFFLEIVE
jgi:predicted RNA-binding protein YlqC (UPF0109 family)